MTKLRSTLASLSLDGWFFIVFLLVALTEGALRKWFGVPTLILMGLRDALALLIIARCLWYGRYMRMPKVFKLLLIWSIILIAYSLVQAIINETPLIVLMIGWRFWLVYLWFSLALACTLSSKEFLISIKMLVAIAVLMAGLAYFQSTLPPSHFINTQPDTDISKIFILAGDKVRVTGTFSFTLGYTCFVALITPFVFGQKWQGDKIFSNRTYYFLCFLSVFLLTFFSGSRAAVIWTSIIFFIVATSDYFVAKKRAGLSKILISFAVVGGFYILITLAFDDNIAAYANRFETASESENIWHRLQSIFFGEPEVLNKISLIGSGFGVGSNAGGMYLSGGIRGFFLVESEPGRNLLEGGFLGGVWLIGKYLLALGAVFWTLLLLKVTGNILPLLLSLTCLYAFSSWAVTGQLSAHAIAYTLLAYLLFVIRVSDFKVKVLT